MSLLFSITVGLLALVGLVALAGLALSVITLNAIDKFAIH